MSKEFEVPPDLAVFESKLRIATVTGSKLNRDQVLFNAGWAAALAQQEAGRSLPDKWFWQAATGAFATIAAALALVVFQQSALNGDSNSIATVATETSAIETDATDLNSTNPTKSVHEFTTRQESAPKRSIQNVGWQSGLRTSMAARGQFEYFDWDPAPSVNAFDSSLDSNPKDIRELLQEFLPKAETKTQSRPQPPIWKWFSQNWGDLI